MKEKRDPLRVMVICTIIGMAIIMTSALWHAWQVPEIYGDIILPTTVATVIIFGGALHAIVRAP